MAGSARTPAIAALAALLALLAQPRTAAGDPSNAATEIRASDAPATEIRAADPPSAATQILAGLSPEMHRRLMDDRVLVSPGEQERGGTIHALVLFERPANEVLRHLIQSTRQTEFRSELRNARLVEESDQEQVVEYEIRMMLTRIRYRALHRWDFEKRIVSWSLDPSYDNDIAVLEGKWELHPLAGRRSLARFGTRIDVGPALPRFLQDYATRRQLPEAMHNVRRWIDSGGAYRP